jgi:hypothetical protein
MVFSVPSVSPVVKSPFLRPTHLYSYSKTLTEQHTHRTPGSIDVPKGNI